MAQAPYTPTRGVTDRHRQAQLLLKPTKSYVTVPLWAWAKADAGTSGGLVISGLSWGLLQPHGFGHCKIGIELLSLLICLADSVWCCFFFQARQLFTGNWSKNTVLSVPTVCWTVVKGKLTSIKTFDCIWVRNGFGSHYLFFVTAGARSWSHSQLWIWNCALILSRLLFVSWHYEWDKADFPILPILFNLTKVFNIILV